MTGYPAPRRVAADPTGTVRVVVVDDSAEVRTLVRTELRLSGAAVVEGEGADGADAVDLARRLQPDAMLLDVSMPGMDGLEALPLVLECSPGTRVVMFSGFDEEPLALRALELGATSYLTKTSSLEDVVNELVGAADDAAAGAGPTEAGSREDDAGRAGSDEAGVDDGAGTLEDQVERFQSVFDDAAIGMATMTLQGRIVRANDALCRILGRGSEDLLGIAYGAAVDDDEALADATAAIVDKGADVVTLEHPQVGDAYRRTTLTVVRDRAGQPLYLFAQCQDVTAQRIAELELTAQRAAVPSHGRRGPRVRHLHAGHRGARHQLERRRGARQGLDRRRGDRQALPHLLSTRAAGGPAPGARARRRGARKGSTRRRGGGSARTAAGSGPSSPSPRSPTRTATTSASRR